MFIVSPTTVAHKSTDSQVYVRNLYANTGLFGPFKVS
jgi:hypothetical protein